LEVGVATIRERKKNWKEIGRVLKLGTKDEISRSAL
jgi:hypothetical protein